MHDPGKQAIQADADIVAASDIHKLTKRVQELERLLARKRMQVEILQQAVALARTKKTDMAVAIACSRQFSMKAVATTLGVARSNIIARRKAPFAKRGPQTRAGDLELAADIRRLVEQRPNHGYRRIASLLRSERRSAGQKLVNVKRVYRLMKKHGLLRQRHTGRDRPRQYDGKAGRIGEPGATPSP